MKKYIPIGAIAIVVLAVFAALYYTRPAPEVQRMGDTPIYGGDTTTTMGSSAPTGTTIDGHVGVVISAASISFANGAYFTNFDQSSAATSTLPPCVLGLNMMVQVATTATNSFFGLVSLNTDIYSNGSATAYKHVGYSSPFTRDFYSISSGPSGTAGGAPTCAYYVTLGTGSTFTTY